MAKHDLSMLTDEEREVLALRLRDQVPAAEIAERLGKSPAEVQRLVRNALLRLERVESDARRGPHPLAGPLAGEPQ